ncbi:MAG: hypothetical protein ACI9BH_003442, partial [Paracoccaceae bacterium]
AQIKMMRLSNMGRGQIRAFDIAGHHVATQLCKRGGQGLSNATSRAGDNDPLAFKSGHFIYSLQNLAPSAW